MKIVYNLYNKNDVIPIEQYLKKRKFAKYFNRETSSAMVSIGKLLKECQIKDTTPIYYSMGIIEYENYGLDEVAKASLNSDNEFSCENFVQKGMSAISPLTQFKVLYNMTLCFICIEYGLHGDNSVLYSSSSGLILQALNSFDFPVLIGAGKLHKNGNVETGFALVEQNDIIGLDYLQDKAEAIELFRRWPKAEGRNG